MSKNKTLNIIFALLAIILVAGLGSLFVNLGMSWFEGLEKPTEWIPSFVIPVVWSIIYISFAVVLFLWLKKEELPLSIFIYLIINGVLNILWCLVFFTLNGLFLGNIIIIINTIFAVKLINEIAKVKPIYSYVLNLYPIWLCIATSLNTAVWILN